MNSKTKFLPWRVHYDRKVEKQAKRALLYLRRIFSITFTLDLLISDRGTLAANSDRANPFSKIYVY
jgi:hypothetical protein